MDSLRLDLEWDYRQDLEIWEKTIVLYGYDENGYEWKVSRIVIGHTKHNGEF